MSEEGQPLTPAERQPPSLREELEGLGPALLRFTRALTRDVDEADDLAQEAMARALRFEDRYTPGTDAKAWLFTIARRLQQKRWRSQKRAPRVVSISDLRDADDAEMEIESAEAVEPAVIKRFERARLMEALERLPTANAVPLRLFAGEGLSYRQIAEVMELPLGTVMSRIFRGRKLLVAYLMEGEQ